MSLNRFMHLRNIYKTKPDFAEMAKRYESFGAYVRQDLRGKVVFDYNDCNALRELTKTLLKKDFDLEIDIPEHRLIPTVPQRLNYILFVEDLVSELTQMLRTEGKEVKEVMGLDVGTGCCAVFPLIGCTLNKKWSFVATDVDPINIESALNNVRKNSLNHRIKIIECEDEKSFVPIVDTIGLRIHFLMTNPPFFSDDYTECDVNSDESEVKMDFHSNDSNMKCRAKPKRNFRQKSCANTSDSIESVVDGGEVEFVSKIIEQSLELKDKIMIYSSMFGKKSSFKQIKAIIKSYVQKGVISSYVWTELCQGFTKRWAIAWTLIKGLNLKEVPTTKAIKAKSSLDYYLPPLMETIDYSIESVSEKIKTLLKNDLKIDSFEVKESKKRIEFRIRAETNVWSNQRKRRRELKRKTQNDSNQELDMSASDGQRSDDSMKKELSIECEAMDRQAMNGKRSLDEMECEGNGNGMEDNYKRSKTNRELSAKELYLLDTSLVIKREKQSIVMQMQTQELAKSKESTHQLFQYFKNNLK